MKKALVAAVVCLFLLSVANAEEPVHFADAALKGAVEDELWVSDPTPTDMLNLTSLDAGSLEIQSLVGLEYAANLTDLRLRFNRIQDISPLAGLTNLRHLVLHRNWLTDLSPLSGLANLVHLDLNDTHSSNISALASLTGLQELILYNNKITDISVLRAFTSLKYLDLRLNPLSEEIYDVDIPLIQANNPGITIEHDRGPYTLTITSTVGGSVINPGEGTFVYSDGTPVYIEAKADPGFVFVGFSGMLNSVENPTMLMMGWNYTIQANFESTLDTLYVDDDALADAGKNNAGVSDPSENGTVEHPYDRIQEAIDVAPNGATVVVRPGTYCENVRIPEKSLTLAGRDPNDPAGTAWPVISANKSNSTLSISGRGTAHCVVSGFVVTGAKGQAAAVSCSGVTATISHCAVGGNRLTGSDVALLQCTNSDVLFTHCTVANNHVAACNGGIRAIASKVAVTNSIFYFNTYSCFNTSIKRFTADAASELTVRYCDIADGWPGEGNIDADPLFVSPGRWVHSENVNLSVEPSDPYAVWAAGDYHLQSDAGRWASQTGDWATDNQTSPCIDAGNPLDPTGYEPAPNGAIVDMGVYGGTTEASLSR